MSFVLENAVFRVQRNGQSRRILDNINLSVVTGELVCVLGPSGCGKSTLLKILAGFYPLSEGSLLVNNHPVSGPSPQRVMLFQEYGLLPWRTVRRNVELGLEAGSLPKHERTAKAAHFIDMVGLTHCTDAYPAHLSGGMQQRVALARAMAVNPEILLMDEPLAALDALTRLRLQEEIRDIWLRCTPTVVFVTHDIEEAVFLANRILIMSPEPSHIQSVIPIPLEHPRDRTSPAFLSLRDLVSAQIGI